jgi:hypothetical protein
MPKKLTPPGTPPNAAPKQLTDEERIARAKAKRERKKKKKA